MLGARGRNALRLHLLRGAVIGMFAPPPIPAWYVRAPWWLIIMQAAALLGILSAVGLYLDRRKWYWTLCSRPRLGILTRHNNAIVVEVTDSLKSRRDAAAFPVVATLQFKKTGMPADALFTLAEL